MKDNYTHITVILDRTGSMESIRDDTIGGFNAFLSKQQKEEGEATLTLVQFDSQDPYEVLNHFAPIAAIPKLTRDRYVPRAGTPLYDALGRGINDLATSLSRIPAPKRPAKVVVAVVTDGHENASTEFTKAQIAKMITEKTSKADWQFVFLSADLAAFEESGNVGFRHDSRMLFEKSAKGSREAWSSLHQSTADYRKGKKKHVGFDKE